MSIIFQLFSAEDLQKLSYDELIQLRDKIIEALRPPDQPTLTELPPLKLNLTPKTEIDQNSPPELRPPPQWVQEALLKRFNEVFQQLKTSPDNLSQQPFNFNDLIRQRNDLYAQAKEKLILEWAISCELNHIEFYYSLLKARKAAYDFFEQTISARTQKAPEIPGTKEEEPPKFRKKEPDSLYSPFNPRHPLSGLFYNLSKPVPNPPGGPTPSGS
jgi:hypothetical protein